MRTRKSMHCLKSCDGIGCYETYEDRVLGGIPKKTWVIHCKALDKIHNSLPMVRKRRPNKERIGR